MSTFHADDLRMSGLLAYCRIDQESLSPSEEALLQSFYSAAVDYMADAGVSRPDVETGRAAKYDLCVNAMVLDFWDHRDLMEPGAVVENPSFRRMLNQLKLTEGMPHAE